MSTELQDRKGFAEQEINLSYQAGVRTTEKNVRSLEDTAQEQYSSGTATSAAYSVRTIL